MLLRQPSTIGRCASRTWSPPNEWAAKRYGAGGDADPHLKFALKPGIDRGDRLEEVEGGSRRLNGIVLPARG
jgi:hypothetical protein